MIIDKIALVLAIIGGLNWGSIGIFGFDLVAAPSAGSSTRWWAWPPCGASPCFSATPRQQRKTPEFLVRNGIASAMPFLFFLSAPLTLGCVHAKIEMHPPGV